MTDVGGRAGVIVDELERVTAEYLDTKARYEKAQAEFEAAREKFTGIMRLAQEVLAQGQWYRWQAEHSGIKLVGLQAGDAILNVLRSHALESAWEHVTSKEAKRFTPTMDLDRIVAALQDGGYVFQSVTPRREVNAALRNLDGVTKTAAGGYQSAIADETLQSVREWMDNQPPEPEKDDDDAPF